VDLPKGGGWWQLLCNAVDVWVADKVGTQRLPMLQRAQGEGCLVLSRGVAVTVGEEEGVLTARQGIMCVSRG
jgi:hypothetical protein